MFIRSINQRENIIEKLTKELLKFIQIGVNMMTDEEFEAMSNKMKKQLEELKEMSEQMTEGELVKLGQELDECSDDIDKILEEIEND